MIPLASPWAWECGQTPSLEVPWLGTESANGCVSGNCEPSGGSLSTPLVACVLQRPDDRLVDGSDVLVVEASLIIADGETPGGIVVNADTCDICVFPAVARPETSAE